MKLLLGLAAALLVRVASGAPQQDAEVYILQADSSSFPDSVPRIPREVARHILLQRAARDLYGISLQDVPAIIDHETVISHLNTYSKAPSPLFAEADERQPAQLIMLLQGVDAKIGKQLKGSLGKKEPAFTVADPPSYEANNNLLLDFNVIGVPKQPSKCTVQESINPFETNCWERPSSVVRYDLKKNPELVQDLVKNLPSLLKYVKAGDIEAAILLHPESSRSSRIDSWTTSQPADLRRRAAEFEEPLADGTGASKPGSTAAAPGHTSPPHRAGAAASKAVPACFATYNSCVAGTDNCTGHGLCQDKYENDTRGDEKPQRCFSCACLASVDDNAVGRSTTHWGGSMCQKQDVSSSFWLIAGATLLLGWVAALAVGMLYSVGEEKLPGVIGAGVSRTK